jgi:mitochondrial fission protein ELM1
VNIVAFFDGRPGHEKQTRGLLRALDSLCPLHVEDVYLPECSWLENMTRTGDAFLFADADLLLGTGSGCHAPMLAAKFRHRIPAATIMTPDFLWRWAFDLCFSPMHDGATGTNIFPTIGPPNPLFDQGKHDVQRGLMLVGGLDPKSHIWHDEEIVAAVTEILTREQDITWHISSSPRTPVATEALLARLPERFPPCRFFSYKDTPPGWVEREYHESAWVWVTADSISMVYEALSAGCAVGLIPVEWRRADDKFQRSATHLAEQGLIRRWADWLQGDNPHPPPVPLNEARRCAEEIVRRWCQTN